MRWPTSLDERLQEMNAAMVRLLSKGDEKVVMKEEAAPPGDFVPEGGPSEDIEAVAMDTDPAETPAAPGDIVPEEAAGDHAMGGGYPSSSRPFSALPSNILEETVFHIEGFPENFPRIGKKSADLAKQLTKEEIAALFSKLKTHIWTRSAVERVLEVFQIYKRQVAQQHLSANPGRCGPRQLLGQLDPGSTTTTLMCPNCFSDWQRPDNRCRASAQKTVIAVDKGPPSAEIKLGESSWRMFCGLQGVSWHTDGDEAEKAAASVDIGPPTSPTYGPDGAQLCRPGAYGPEAQLGPHGGQPAFPTRRLGIGLT